MESEAGLSRWLPDRTPTWTDVAMAGLAVALLAINLLTLPRAEWGWVTAGFVALVVVGGPVAQSSVGTRASDWSEAIGAAGRAAVILLFVVAVWVAREEFGVRGEILSALGSGVMLGVAVLVAVAVARSGAVEGW